MSIKGLLDFIAQPESGGDYNIVWGNIGEGDQPPKPLTQMTLAEVLAWQDSIDPHYMSEAAGRYQIIEDTLRGLYREAGVPLEAKFNRATQDKLATALLRRRGLDDYLDGDITAEHFANSLAKEWASLPVVSGPKKGRSYYGGDGLNSAHVGVDEFLQAVRDVRGKPRPKPRPKSVGQRAKSAAPEAGAAGGVGMTLAIEAAPAAGRMLGGLAETAQIIGMVVVAACVAYLIWRKMRNEA